MQINLKQPEIIKALQLYIAQLGINLKGKTVAIKFTAGRGEAGLSADLVITEDTSLPDFGPDEALASEQAAAPAVAKLALVSNNAEAPVAEPETAQETATAEPEAIEAVAEKPVKTASLFN